MPSRLKAFAAKTTKVSRVTAKIAGIESIANIRSKAATVASAASSGVAIRRPSAIVVRREPSYSSEIGIDAAKQPHREGRLRVDLLAALPGDLDRGEQEQGTERVGGRLEGIERRRPGDDEHRPESDCEADAAEQHQPALLLRDGEEREQHREDEEVVERERLLDQEARQVLTRSAAVTGEHQQAGESEAGRRPDERPTSAE